MPGLRIPFLEFLSPMMPKLKRSWGTTIFIYGGYWKAVPVSPAGFITNSLYGRSTNPEMLNGPADTRVDVDDYLFLRPTQSESVTLQSGGALGGCADITALPILKGISNFFLPVINIGLTT